MVNKIIKSNNNNFINLREKFSNILEKVSLEYEKISWDFYINSTNENYKKLNKIQDKYSKIFKDKKLYKEFLKIKEKEYKNLSKHEQKQLKNIIKDFKEELEAGDDLKELRKIENNITQKINTYIYKIDDKEVTKTEINQILENEKNPKIRKKAYEAKIKGGDLIAKDLQNFVKLRNKYAKKQGYNNYFEYKLKEDYEVDIKELEELLNSTYKKTKTKIKNIDKKTQKELKEIFKTEDLKQYHYGILSDKKPNKKVNNFLKNKEQIVEICKKTYKNMGYDIEKLEKNKNLTLDLFPRKGKNTHGFCFEIEPGKDSRILANLTNNINSIDTLCHELGHCVYNLGISEKLQYLDKGTYPAMTEAIAMMMGDLQKRETILSEIVPEKILTKFIKTFKKDEAKFVSWSLVIINFEKEMYKNPNQNLKKLWHNLNIKYRNRSDKEVLNNERATIPHYLSHPAYYQNYFRATLIKAQIYNYLKENLGNITENKKTSKFLKDNLFKYGTSFEENELIEKFTGKKLSSDDFLSNLK